MNPDQIIFAVDATELTLSLSLLAGVVLLVIILIRQSLRLVGGGRRHATPSAQPVRASQPAARLETGLTPAKA